MLGKIYSIESNLRVRGSRCNNLPIVAPKKKKASTLNLLINGRKRVYTLPPLEPLLFLTMACLLHYFYGF